MILQDPVHCFYHLKGIFFGKNQGRFCFQHTVFGAIGTDQYKLFSQFIFDGLEVDLPPLCPA